MDAVEGPVRAAIFVPIVQRYDGRMIKCRPELVDETVAELFELLRVWWQLGEEFHEPLKKEVVVVDDARDGSVE